MKTQILKKWVKALTSGKYKQGRLALKTKEGRYCCLGVLCDLHAKETGGKWKDPTQCEHFSYCGTSGVLPMKVRRWAGLKDNDPILTSDGYRASDLNDEGKRFKTIAKLIVEAQKKKLI